MADIKEIKIWKTTFYKNMSKDGGAMAHAIQNIPDNHVIIHSQTQKNGRLWGYATPNHLLKLLEKNRGIYEVMASFPFKVYFDIDKKQCDDGNQYLEHVKNIIQEFFPNCEFAISGSITQVKTSFHIVLNNYIIHNEDERAYMKHITKYLCEERDDGFDWKVYTKNRNMKAINQSKLDGRVQEVIENNDLKKHIITAFFTQHPLPFQELPQKVFDDMYLRKAKKSFDITTLPKLVLQTPENIDFITMSPDVILQLLPIDKSFDHSYTHLVARFCFTNEITLERFLSWIKHKHTDMPKKIINKWCHHWDNLHKFPPVECNRMKSVLCYFYPDLKKDIHFRKFKELFNLPNENIKPIDTLSQEQFFSDEKYSIFNVGMGGGKTHQTIEYLSNVKNFIWICPNKALATNTLGRLSENNITISNYLDFNSAEKKNGCLTKLNKLLIVVNSIHYLFDAKFDVVVIDEIETLLEKFLGEFMVNKMQCWTIFTNILRNAKKVILLDAFTTNKTIRFIKNIENSLPIAIYQRINEPSTRNVYFMNCYKKMTMDIIQALKDDKKLFIFYPYKNTTGKFQSMNDFHKMLEDSTGKKGKFYHADIDDANKKELQNVNHNWSVNINFVLTNSIITCGINYDIHPLFGTNFDSVYLYVASFSSPRDIIQVSYRPRVLETNNIYISFLGAMKQPNTWKVDTANINCSTYTELINDTLTEKKAPIKKAIKQFCSYAKYKQNIDTEKISKKLDKELTELLDNCSLYASYENIEDIDYWQSVDIQLFMNCHRATMEQKLKLQKYYFNNRWGSGKNELLTIKLKDESESQVNLLEYVWNSRLIGVLTQLQKILIDENSIYKSIMKTNNLTTIFPTDIKKIKLSNEQIEQIMTEYKFKYLNASSASSKILKEIFNTYFQKHIINIEYDEHRHATYVIDEPLLSQLYKFVDKYTIVENEHVSKID